ncbi:MAG: DUF6616 family protein [Enterobacteriaceae bacterium]
MAYYLTELYTVKPAWESLPSEQRQEYLQQIGAGLTQLLATGIEVLSMGEVERDHIYSASQQFYAIWRLPDKASIDTLLAAIDASGWHRYFTTINAAGSQQSIEGHLQQLVAI